MVTVPVPVLKVTTGSPSALGVVDQQQVDAFAPQPVGVVQPISIDEPTSLADKPMAGYFVG